MSREENETYVRKIAADLRNKIVQAGHSEPLASWVMDTNGGILILDVPGLVDTSSCPALSWDSKRFFVFVFNPANRSVMEAIVKV